MTPLEQFHYDSQTLEMALGGMYALNQIKPFADGPGLVERIRELALRFDANPPKETQDKWAVLCGSYDDLNSYTSGYRKWFQVYDTDEEALEIADRLMTCFEGITRETLLVCRCSEVQDMLA